MSKKLKTSVDIWDTIYLYTATDILKKLDVELKQLPTGTIKGSAIRDELFILNENKGFYFTPWKVIECNIEKVEKVEYNYYGDEKIVVEYKTDKLTEVEDVVRFISNYNLASEERVNKIIKDCRNYFYYELEVARNKKRFYAQNDDDYIGVYFHKDRFNSKESYIETGSLKLTDGVTFEDKITNYAYSIADFILDLKVTKINNGYIYNNSFYESLEEVIETTKLKKEETNEKS